MNLTEITAVVVLSLVALYAALDGLKMARSVGRPALFKVIVRF